MAVLGLTHAGFQGTQATQLAFHTHADGVGHVHHLFGDSHVVLVAGGALGVSHQRAIHHHRGETVGGSTKAGGRAVAVVLVHHHRDVGIGFDCGQDQVAQEIFTGVLAGTAGGLQNHRRVGLTGRLHDRLHLLQVVYVEGRDAIAVLSGMVEQQPKRNERHGKTSRGRELNWRRL